MKMPMKIPMKMPEFKQVLFSYLGAALESGAALHSRAALESGAALSIILNFFPTLPADTCL